MIQTTKLYLQSDRVTSGDEIFWGDCGEFEVI